jgi:hypothetical protein
MSVSRSEFEILRAESLRPLVESRLSYFMDDETLLTIGEFLLGMARRRTHSIASLPINAMPRLRGLLVSPDKEREDAPDPFDIKECMVSQKLLKAHEFDSLLAILTLLPTARYFYFNTGRMISPARTILDFWQNVVSRMSFFGR